MNLLRTACLVLALAFAVPATAADVPLAGDTAKAQAAWGAFERWIAAYEKGDLDGVMAIFAPDVVFSWQGIADQRVDDLRKAYVADLGSRAPGTTWVPQVEEVYADGKLAFVRSVWEQVVTAEDGTATKTARNRSLDVLRLDDDGQWRIFRSLNYPEKP
jgi:uncharacterized protein (TIGR02246 family)